MKHRSPSFNGSSGSLPSLPEHEVYTPQRKLWGLIDKGRDDDTSRNVVISVLVATSLLLLCSTILTPSPDNRRLSTLSVRTVLFDDGTLYTPQNNTESLCEYFTQTSRQHTIVRRIHLHFEGFNLEDYLGSKLIADAARVPLHLSEDFGNGASKVSSEALRVGRRPADHGKVWGVEQLCQLCRRSLCQDYLHLVPKADQQRVAYKVGAKGA